LLLLLVLLLLVLLLLVLLLLVDLLRVVLEETLLLFRAIRWWLLENEMLAWTPLHNPIASYWKDKG
jgi:hypothetical protein